MVLGTSSEPVWVMAMRMASASALKLASAMWWLLTPRMLSTWSVTPAANANDSRTCGIISVDTACQRQQEPLGGLTVSDLLAREGKVTHEVRPGGDVDDGAREGLCVSDAVRAVRVFRFLYDIKGRAW